jgi:hypothetical protein
MNPNMSRLRAWLWWLVPFAALALLLGMETDWGRSFQRLPGPAPAIEPKPVAVALLPEYRVDGGLGAHAETVSRTLFNPPPGGAPAQTGDNARSSMPKGKFVLTEPRSQETATSPFSEKSPAASPASCVRATRSTGFWLRRWPPTVSDSRRRRRGGVGAQSRPGPKTTVQPTPPPAAAPPAPGAPLPGAVPPATPAAGQLPLDRQRRCRKPTPAARAARGHQSAGHRGAGRHRRRSSRGAPARAQRRPQRRPRDAAATPAATPAPTPAPTGHPAPAPSGAAATRKRPIGVDSSTWLAPARAGRW